MFKAEITFFALTQKCLICRGHEICHTNFMCLILIWTLQWLSETSALSPYGMEVKKLPSLPPLSKYKLKHFTKCHIKRRQRYLLTSQKPYVSCYDKSRATCLHWPVNSRPFGHFPVSCWQWHTASSVFSGSTLTNASFSEIEFSCCIFQSANGWFICCWLVKIFFGAF